MQLDERLVCWPRERSGTGYGRERGTKAVCGKWKSGSESNVRGKGQRAAGFQHKFGCVFWESVPGSR